MSLCLFRDCIRVVFYKGVPYYKQKESLYFKNKHRGYLHRRIYEDNFGTIPKGFQIHHRDGNPLNNQPSNLQALSVEDHLKLHGLWPLRIKYVRKPDGSNI